MNFRQRLCFLCQLVLFSALPTLTEQAQGQDLDGVSPDSPYITVLGVAQDGGFPQASCNKDCCRELQGGPIEGPSCLALVDPQTGQRWLFECTPQFPQQLARLNAVSSAKSQPGIDGIFLTHAHIGHYAGLVHLGREVMGAKEIPVHVMPRMAAFLKSNGPWSQLVNLKNIELNSLVADQPVQLNERLQVTPLVVPHRDEFSETVAYKIQGPEKSVLFLPDIDKWERWETRIEDVIKDVDVAYLDATFYDNAELPGRDMSQIPHPFIVESVRRFGSLTSSQRSKVRFIHLNHSNPALQPKSKARERVQKAGMSVAQTGERVDL